MCLIAMDFVCNHLPAPSAKYTLHHSVLISALVKGFIAFYCKLLKSFLEEDEEYIVTFFRTKYNITQLTQKPIRIMTPIYN